MASVRQPSLLALRAFEAAARLLSFTDAARELHVSQAAVSRHVRLLERDLAVQLFRRLHRHVELTGAGRTLASGIAAGFQEIRRAVERVRVSTERALRITAEPAFAALWLVPRLDRFSTQYPAIELSLETSLEFRVLGRNADVAIRYLSTTFRKRSRGARHLLAIDGVPVIAGSGRVSSKPSGDRSVLGYRLLHDDDGTSWRNWFAAAGLSGYRDAKHASFSDHSLALDAARRGQGAVLGTPFLIEPELRSGTLMTVGDTRIPLGDYWLLQASDRATAEVRGVFIEWLEAQLAAAIDAPSTRSA
jgi:LysR family transcriptional regulator, glycine cleavage system transcriptional activator